MRKGDISNKVSSYNVGVRLNDFLVAEKQMNLFTRLWSKVGGKVNSTAIDTGVARLVETLYIRTSLTVDFVVVAKKPREAEKYSEIIGDLPHNRIHIVEDLYGVENLLYNGVLSFFVTTPFDVGHFAAHAYTLGQFNNLLNKGLRNL